VRIVKTRSLLLCGAFAGPLFLLVVMIQDYTRPGFDPRLLPLSMLALGALGWIQIANFVGTGVLNLLYARGLRTRLAQAPGAVAVPQSIGVYGLALIVVGVFRTDPANGFPPGAVAPASPSWHGFIHALVALPLFIALAMALVGFYRYFLRRGETGWAAYAGTSALVMMGFFFAGVSHPVLLARLLRLATLIGWLAPSLIAVTLLDIHQEV
jgi:uncharacterized protein DUF998